jgi:hypothetical protein
MKWDIVTFNQLIPGEKYMIVHSENYNFIFPWHREYYGRFTHMEYRQAYFNISYCYDYIVNEQIIVTINMAFNPTVCVHKMIRTGQTNMERRSYEMVMQQLIPGIISPAYI